MKFLLLITSVLISIAVTSGKQIEVPSSKLMLDYNWPEPKKNLERFPHAKSCSHFYVSKPDGKSSLKECPENELFDFRTLRCRRKEVAKCWNDLLKRDHLKKIKRRFSCPFPWGLYPDVEDCSAFYDCLSGKPYLRKCPSSTLFDKAERTCVNENEALCADLSDIVEVGYKCPSKWGYFTYSKDCSKFYECLRKVPSLRSCKENMLFDNLNRKCMPVSDVDCGERFNPYEKNKESTEYVSTGEKGITAENIPTGRILETTKLTSGEVTTGRVSNKGEGMTTKITPRRRVETTIILTSKTKDVTSNFRQGLKTTPRGGVQKITKLTPTSEDVTGRVSNGGDGMTTKVIPTGGVQEITKLTPIREDVTTGRFSNGGDGMTTKIIPTEGVQEITKLTPIREDVTTGRFSNGGDGMMTKIIPTGVQEITKLTPIREDVTTGRFSNGGDGMTTKIIPTEGVQEITKLTPIREDVTTGRFSNGGDGMMTKIIPTGVQEITKLTPIREDVTTGRFSNGGDGMTTKIIPTEGVQEITKLTPIREDVTTGRFSNGGDGMMTKIIPTGVQEITKLTPIRDDVTTGRFSNGGDGMTTKITPTGGVQKMTNFTSNRKEFTEGRVSPGGMTTRYIPTRGTQQTTKLILTGEDITGRISAR